MDYTKNPDSVIFLKDTDIVQDVERKNSLGIEVLSNGVASYDFANNISSTANDQINNVDAKVDAQKSWTKEEFQNTSSFISNVVSVSLDEAIKTVDAKVDAQKSWTKEEFENTSSYINDTVSVSLNNAITAVDAKVDELGEKTATSAQGLCTIIDSKTNYLNDIISNDISTAIDNANAAFTEFKASTETSSANLTAAIDGIKADVKGGVNYKGHLKLNVFSEPQDLSTYVSFLHGGSYQGDTITIPDDVAAAELNNGWMYYVSLTGDGISSYTTKDGIKFVPGNYIIVHAHNTDGDASRLSSVTLSNLNRSNIDIVQVTDSDLVRFKDLNAALTGDTAGTLGGISAAVKDELSTTSAWVTDTVSTSLMADYTKKLDFARDERSRLCIALSDALTTEVADREAYGTATDSKINEISNTTVPEIKAALQKETDARVAEDAIISGKIDAKVSVNKYSAVGDMTSSQVEQLKINRMTAAQYAQLVADDKVSEYELYGITDAEMNAYGRKILSVGAPQSPLDAANKSYVDTAVAKADKKVDGISSSARTEFEQTSAYIDGISTTLSNKLTADYALKDYGTFRQIQVSGQADFNNVNAMSMHVDALTAVSEITAPRITATAINATTLRVHNSNVVLSTGDTAINVTTKRGLQDFLVNGTSLQDSIATTSANTLTAAKSYSNQLSTDVSAAAREQIAAALTDAKSYTDILSIAIDNKLTATSSYINVQDAMASANAYNKVKADLTSQLDSNNHLKLFIDDKIFADYKLHNVLQHASLQTINGQKAIVFTWNTEPGVENTTSVLVQDLIDTYQGDGTYIKLSSDSTTFYLDINTLSNALGVGLLSGRVSSIETTCTVFNRRLTALESDNTNSQHQIGNLITQLTGETGIYATLTSHGTSITSLQQSVGSINTAIENIRSGETNSIQALTNEITAIIEPDLKELNTAKNQLSSNLIAANSKISQTEQSIQSIQTQISAPTTGINAKLQAANEKIEQISMGYATKSMLTDYALADNVYSKSSTSSNSQIQTAFTNLTSTYYTSISADSTFAKKSDLSGIYSKTEADTKFVTKTDADHTYETAANVNNLISNIKDKLSDVVSVDKFDSSTTELSTSVNMLIDRCNSILSVLKTISKNSSQN